MQGFTRKDTFENHKCADSGIKKKKVDFRTEGKLLKDLAHYIERGFTKGSDGEIAEKNKLLKKPEASVRKITNPRYVVFDFESDTHTNIHEPNHVEVDVLEIDQGQTHNYEKCLETSFGFNGYDCCEKFCDWLFTKENRDVTVMAHNGAGYDFKFILKYCLNKGLRPSAFIRQGSRITYMHFNSFYIRFIDSYHFFRNR